jgi:hypothetical protein
MRTPDPIRRLQASRRRPNARAIYKNSFSLSPASPHTSSQLELFHSKHSNPTKHNVLRQTSRSYCQGLCPTIPGPSFERFHPPKQVGRRHRQRDRRCRESYSHSLLHMEAHDGVIGQQESRTDTSCRSGLCCRGHRGRQEDCL